MIFDGDTLELLTVYEQSVEAKWRECPWLALHRQLQTVSRSDRPEIWFTARKRDRWRAWCVTVERWRSAGMSDARIADMLRELVDVCDERRQLPQPWLFVQGDSWHVADDLLLRSQRERVPVEVPRRPSATLRAKHLRLERRRDLSTRRIRRMIGVSNEHDC